MDCISLGDFDSEAAASDFAIRVARLCCFASRPEILSSAWTTFLFTSCIYALVFSISSLILLSSTLFLVSRFSKRFSHSSIWLRCGDAVDCLADSYRSWFVYPSFRLSICVYTLSSISSIFYRLYFYEILMSSYILSSSIYLRSSRSDCLTSASCCIGLYDASVD